MPRSMHWHIWDYASITYSNVFCLSLFLAFHLVGVKCQPATFGQPQRYSPASKIRCLDIVSPQSSVKINQISLDESGEHVGICSEDGKVRSLRSSPPVTDPWACSERKKKPHQSVFFIFHNSSSDSYKTHLISVKLYANDVELGGEFSEGTSSTVGALTWKFYLHHIYT